MIIYFDTSVLVKNYVNKEHTEAVVAYWGQTETIVISEIAYAEFFSAVNRRRREGSLSEEDYQAITERFKNDWEAFEKIPVNPRLNQQIEDLLTQYPLRGFDAIHLASALSFRQHLADEPLLFICADRRLCETAQAENLDVVNLS